MTDITVYVGDTVPLTVSWFIPSTENPYIAEDAIISAATVKVIHTGRKRTVIINDEPATVLGNETIFIVPSESNKRAGNYTAYMTAEFNDGNVLTRKITYYSNPKN